MESVIKEQDILGIECRHVVHIPSVDNTSKDLHLVKEVVHTKDGRKIPRVKLVPNFKRPFWVTKKACRNHQDKKEYEEFAKLDKFVCTQSGLKRAVARALDNEYSQKELRDHFISPYLYGADISSTSIIKYMYKKKYPNVSSFTNVAMYDFETDVVNGTNEIVMVTVVVNNIVYTYVTKGFVEGITDIESHIEEKTKKYLDPILKGVIEVSYETYIVEKEIDILLDSAKLLHRLMPDFVAIWNIDFEMTKILEACERAQIDPKDIFCDPNVPEEMRFFKYKRGPQKKITASKKVQPINPASQWHVTTVPASFYFIDAMCCYRHIRTGSQEESSYKLDHILKRNDLEGKLEFEPTKDLKDLAWHYAMQKYYKVEYIVYNRYDCIGMVLLDNKTKDLKSTLYAYAVYSDLADFRSQPKRIMNDYFYYLLEMGCVLGIAPPRQNEAKPDEDIDDEEDDMTEDEINEIGFRRQTPRTEYIAKVLSLKGWVVTLPAHNVVIDGLRVFKESINIISNARVYVFDSDAVSSYPSDIRAANVSKETTFREIITIEGIPEQVFRMNNINLMSGATNAVEYCTAMFGFPNLSDLSELYDKMH